MATFETLHLWQDAEPRDGPDQMALDELLLEQCECAVLRSYRWAGAWVSFGYGQSLSAVEALVPGRAMVRRWTAGGVVEHTADWTFSLIVPRNHSLAEQRPLESYRILHQAIASTLVATGCRAALAPAPDAPTPACFVGQPACHDVIDAAARKLCGGAQRRARQGFLHQGSVQNVAVPDDFLTLLGRALARKTPAFSPGESLGEAAALRADQKYRTAAWTARIA